MCLLHCKSNVQCTLKFGVGKIKCHSRKGGYFQILSSTGILSCKHLRTYCETLKGSERIGQYLVLFIFPLVIRLHGNICTSLFYLKYCVFTEIDECFEFLFVSFFCYNTMQEGTLRLLQTSCYTQTRATMHV